MKVNDLLVKLCRVSKDEASSYIENNRVQVNGRKAVQKEYLLETDAVEQDGKLLREAVVYRYYAFYKPRGIECTLNPAIANNLRELIPFPGHFYPVGRLDKQSEGLLLITNDGDLYQQIALSENRKKKEYEVTVNKALSDVVTRIDSHSFRIILTQGLNRQIRRMCHTLGLEVNSLKRIRISSVTLDGLKPGEYRELRIEDISPNL
ncbi:MAG: ribosomal large subunit pseudouridine synthase F [Bacteroidetes bacterium]|nr:ribosomal large subunit pseudouridine synthase F [Bacteroidota bacterium]